MGRSRRRHRAIPALAAAALIAAAAPAVALRGGDIDATVTASHLQGQSGAVIRAVAFVQANEQLTVDGRGTVRVGGERRRLRPKATPRELPPDSGFALKLRPTPRVAQLLADALNDGRRPRATLDVILTTPDGRTESTRYRVRLTR